MAPGVVPLGVLFGVAAADAGFAPWQSVLFSLGVIAGATQFAAVAMIEQGAALLPIIGLVVVMNARYVLLSMAALELARQSDASFWSRVTIALGVVEETFAVQAAWHRESPVPTKGLIMISLAIVTMWVASTWVGAVLQTQVPPMAHLGADYALPGIFVGLLGVFTKEHQHLMAGGAAVLLGAVFGVFGLTTAGALLLPTAVALMFSRGGAS